MSPKPGSVHLLISCFGLWGEGKHLKPTEDLILKAWEKEEKKHAGDRQVDEFILLDPEVNASMKTLDGIDLCASRIRDAVMDAIAQLEADGKKLTRFSMLGYSLGGLVARYLAALLLPALIERRVKLVNFITIASPAVGIPAFATWSSSIFIALGSRLLSRTGSQLYARDSWADTGKPLLENLTTGIFKETLERFERIEVYAAAVNDVTVPFVTAAFEKHDPWAGPLALARKARSDRHEEDTAKIDIRDGDLEIVLDEDYWPMIKSWKTLPSDKNRAKPQKRKWRLPRVPNFMRPSWYPFLPVPARYAMAFGFPIFIPLVFLFFLGRFSIEKHRSARRVKVLLLDPKHQEKMHLASFSDRANMALEEVMEASMPVGPPSAATTEPPSLSSSRPQSPSTSQSSRKAVASQHDKHQPHWTETQLRMLDNLATIPQVKKHFAWFPELRNAHGAIICRHPVFGTDGKMVIQHVADHFVF